MRAIEGVFLALLAACDGPKESVQDTESPLDTGVPGDTSPVFDLDGDGYDGSGLEATDCDDTDPAVHPGASETWYDGVDQDCDDHRPSLHG